jgi:CRISPR system Cascade subunit CasC
MSLPRFIQIHTLHNYPGALLNRDDAGLAKRLPYGDAVRTRISSQCLKRHWRTADDHFSLANLGFDLERRSTDFLDRIRLNLEQEGIEKEHAFATVEALAVGLKLKRNEKKKDRFRTSEVLLLGVNEVAYLTSFCLELARQYPDSKALAPAMKECIDAKPKGDQKSFKDNLKTLLEQSGLVSALFGRMVTSDVLASRDAAVYVAHAFTVHEAQVENDYFTVVDDLVQESEELGSAGIFDTELASGLYYGYVVVDVPQLIANLEGEKASDWSTLPADKRELTGRVVQHLLHLIATVSPGAKRGSTAPFEWAKFMLVEAGDWQPRSLAGAFQNALSLRQSSIRQAAVTKISEEIGKLDAAYGAPLERRFLALDDAAVPNAERLPLTQLADWVKAMITQGTTAKQGA